MGNDDLNTGSIQADLFINISRSSHLSKDVEKESKLQESVSKMLHESNKLEQDHMEGVEEKEWVSCYLTSSTYGHHIKIWTSF